ncbi:MAG: type VI secretion system protein TssA [Holosporales bacterium]|jgi:type VI secretion system protein ImpA|nr:type VI secretion system protein TssA [Holosporales bacterium]
MPLNLVKLSTPFPGGAGQNLRYDPVYDKIKDARFEEDSSLSRGVWKRDLKKADWAEVHKLCSSALEESSKDLQIVGWLCEAECHLERWNGLHESIELAHQFCEHCWEICYPEIDDDLEHRIRVLDWFVEKMTECSLFMPIAPSNGFIQQPLDLSMWLTAQNFDLVARRSGASEAKMQEAESSGQITLKRFRSLVRQANVNDVMYVAGIVDEIYKKSSDFSMFLQDKCRQFSPSFKRFHEQLVCVTQICKFSLEGRVVKAAEKPEPKEVQPSDHALTTITTNEGQEQINVDQDLSNLSNLTMEDIASHTIEGDIIQPSDAQQQQQSDDEVTIAGRQDAYKAVGDLADYLIEVDPQSPGPYLIKMVSSWSDKPLPAVLDDVATGASAGHKVLKMLSEVMRRGA